MEQQLGRVLAELQTSSGDIEASAVVSEDGLIMASSLPKDVEEGRVAGMSAVLLSMGSRAAIELRRGDLEQVTIQGSVGYVVITQAGRHSVLVAIANRGAKLGLLNLNMSRGAAAIGAALS
ncbi:MAG: roadblock/LC7 domain-containing protein [Actinomycetota bacterium]|nr:roadblock/LC7 domain-containing protein [Actinomycetota bacterium]